MRRRKGFVHQQRHYLDRRLERLENGRRTLASLPLKRLPDVKGLRPPLSSETWGHECAGTTPRVASYAGALGVSPSHQSAIDFNLSASFRSVR